MLLYWYISVVHLGEKKGGMSKQKKQRREGRKKGGTEGGKNKNKSTSYVHLTAIIIFQLNEWWKEVITLIFCRLQMSSKVA